MKSLHPISENPPPERTRVFWPSVRLFIETIWALFGGPETIAALHTLARNDHALLCAWLRKAEILVRRLLAIEAACFEVIETKYKRTPAKQRAKTWRQFHADEPHLWRVSFSLMERPCRKRADRSARLAAQFVDAWPLAERLEALLRVFDAPENYIKRAARLLRRAPQRIGAALAVPVIEEFEDFRDPLRLALLQARMRFRPRDTS